MQISNETKIARNANEKALLKKPNVIGVGVGEKITGGVKIGEEAVIVFVREKKSVEGDGAIPQTVNGDTKTDVVVLGDVKAQNIYDDSLGPPSNMQGFGNSKLQQERVRPIQPGISIGHYQVSAGTIGIMVQDSQTLYTLILSNNHILANGNDAEIGSAIIQPGRADGGTVENDIVGSLYRFIPIRYAVEATCSIAAGFAGIVNRIAKLIGASHRLQAYDSNVPENKIDAAVALPEVEVEYEILSIGRVFGTKEVQVGDTLRKFGRTTGYTEGAVIYMGATIDITYGEKTARFVDQIVSTPMSEGGDSGSLVVAGESDTAIGLLFAGSEQATIINPIGAVLDGLGVEIG